MPTITEPKEALAKSFINLVRYRDYILFRGKVIVTFK